MILHAPVHKLSRQPRAFVLGLCRDSALLAKLMTRTIRSRRLICLFSACMVFLGLWLAVLPNDDNWLRMMHSSGDRGQRAAMKFIAGQFSFWGDFGTYSVMLGTAVWFAGWWRRSRHLKLLAVATMASATFAGLTANVLRASVGRPRPRTGLADGLYGPSWKSDYHSLPSAHTATAFASSLPVLVAAPQVGVPLVAFAGAVSWSRMQLNQHRPTDVVVAVWIASMFGLPLGLAVRRLRSKGDMETETEPPSDEPVEMGEAVNA